MATTHGCRATIVVALLSLGTEALAAVWLVPIVTGLASPVFVGHAGDGSNRLFIVERAGIIKVLQPGASAPAEFLDIRSKIRSTGLEQGLLGLAFHPLYAANGRFFVFYTRTADGALVIAEYGVSSDPDVAAPAESIILTILHPGQANHNGGMLAFGDDGYLYIGVGDGGSADDPPNNAQNINALLGKVLRIDINPPGGSGPYVTPPTNPFFGSIPGRDEIYAFGLRNPWRFSFDRSTGQQWLADVGQGSREEVDTPIVAGANYGWRVYEGFDCTDTDPLLCDPANYTFPIFEYTHGGGRCSITGGYVYRGSQSALPDGTYVYGDYCSGEIFTWDGAQQQVLLDTTMRISSFGEGEQGEVYVVDLNGSVSQIAALAPCPFGLSARAQAFAANGGHGAVMVTSVPGCPWMPESNHSWIHITSGATGSGSGTLTYFVDPNPSSEPRTGSMTMAGGGQRFTVTQSGVSASCMPSLSPPPATFGKGGRRPPRSGC